MATLTGQPSYSTHENPVWRERANFIINAPLREVDRFEQLWCRQLDEDQFEVCCIPFFVYNLALGDIVRTAPSGGMTYMISQVLNPSGRFVFRVWFGESFHPKEQIVKGLDSLGTLLEWSSPNLLAVDAHDSARAQVVAKYLAKQEDAGRLMYETGKAV
ncbi:DUF4265 domain-containing protein [Aestuariimicrobium sp. T2.26MG-19.2B]|uniref:DUF4265 domain-containing protein n=1 Tax=Aestuariimicrobium sp. T2.26MG-19.2B TaxID=3040679 RepID=UPI00253FF5D8|nr:DUF4265 domain-containing protein [Aestuariimicrobium sp. T2.26MG-19.2B]